MDSGPDISADSPELNVNFGDGSQLVSVQRNAIIPIGQNTALMTFVINHIFPAQGNFLVHFVESSRNLNILNLGNSENSPFSVSTMVSINPLTGTQNSVRFLTHPIFSAKAGETFSQNFAAFDPDQDSLSYELIRPLIDKTQTVNAYIFPEGFTIHPISGEMKWNQAGFFKGKLQAGIYTFAVRVNEWRKGALVGYVIRDFQIIVGSSLFRRILPEFTNLTNVELSNPNGVRIEPGQAVRLEISIPNLFPDSLDLIAAGELLENQKVQIQKNRTAQMVLLQINWTPAQTDQRNHPYLLNFRCVGKYTKVSNQFFPVDLSILLYVGAEVKNPVKVTSTEKDFFVSRVLVHPNPSEEYIQFSFSPVKKPIEIQLTDSKGHIIRSYTTLENNDFRFDISSLSGGLYFYRVIFDRRTSVTGKFLKK